MRGLSVQQNLLVRLGKYLHHRRNFMKVASATFGLPFAAVMLWMFGEYGGVGWWLFLVALALPAAWMWAFFIWLALENDIRRISSDSTVQKVNESTRE